MSGYEKQSPSTANNSTAPRAAGNGGGNAALAGVGYAAGRAALQCKDAEQPKSDADIVKEHTQDIATIDDLMSYGIFDWVITDAEASKALRILLCAGDAALTALVAHLDRGSALARLLDNLPEKSVDANALQVLKIFGCRTKQDHQDVRERAIRAVELSGKDPDAELGNYSQTKKFHDTYTQELAVDNGSGGLEAKTYRGTRDYTIGITDRDVVVSVVIRLKPTDEGKNLDELKTRWLDGLRSVWNGKYVVTNGSSTYALRVRPIFVDAGYTDAVHHDLKVVKGPSRSNESKWDTEDKGKTTAAHEFGHILGNRDEYDNPIKDKDGTVTGKKSERDSIMSDYGKVHPRHWDDIMNDLNTMRAATDPKYKLKPTS